MRGLVAGYRPEDTANEGHGVLIEYCVGGAVDDEAVDGLSYGASNARAAMQTGFMELGLDSVDVVQLIDRLNCRLPSCGLLPMAVFAHPTPSALSAHIFEQLAEKRQEPLSARPRAIQHAPPILEVAGYAGRDGPDGKRGPNKPRDRRRTPSPPEVRRHTWPTPQPLPQSQPQK